MLAQLVVAGVAQGALYALVALSLSVLWRATTLVNFGHGDWLMAASFLVYVLVLFAGVPYIAATFVALVVMGLFGVAVHRGLIGPIINAPHLVLAMMGIAVGYALRGAARVVWGRSVLPMPSVFPEEPLIVGGVVVGGDDLVITGVVLAMMGLFFAVFYLTPVGKLMQACFQSLRGAALVGINVGAFNNAMWGTAAVLAALGGVLIAPVTLLYPDMSVWVLIRGFAAMCLGGFGSFHGAVVGGILLGIIETLTGFYISTNYVEITAYLVIIAVLIIRPVGIFGRREVVRV